jgi:hypothetical protein
MRTIATRRSATLSLKGLTLRTDEAVGPFPELFTEEQENVLGRQVNLPAFATGARRPNRSH